MSLTDQLAALYAAAKDAKAPVFAVFVLGTEDKPKAKVLAIPKLGGRAE